MGRNRALSVAIILSAFLVILGTMTNLEAKQSSTVMLGDSLTAGAQWESYFPNLKIYNLGISGDTTFDLLDRLDEVVLLEPTKIFLLIGINDFGRFRPEDILKRQKKIWAELGEKLPQTSLYIISLLPVSQKEFPGWNREIEKFNLALSQLAQEKKLTFINLAPEMADETGSLKAEYTFDGLHLTEKAYRVWADKLKPYLGKR